MHYELTYIVSAQVPETEHGAVEKTVLDLLKKAKTTIKLSPYSLGRKRLAYPIEKQKHGFYYVLEFDFVDEDKSGLQDFETSLRHDKNILRHLIVKISGKPKPVRRNKDAAEPAVKTEKNPRSEQKETKTSEVKAKVDLEDLDQQLDNILEKDQ